MSQSDGYDIDEFNGEPDCGPGLDTEIWPDYDEPTEDDIAEYMSRSDSDPGL
jgi:hypothetical protein